MKHLTFVWILLLIVAAVGNAAERPSNLTRSQLTQLIKADELHDKAVQLFERGKTREAISFAEQDLVILKDVLGEKDPDTAASLHYLGLLLLRIDDYAGARRCYESALAIYREVFHEQAPEIGASLSNLGYFHSVIGDYEAARPYLEQGLAICKEARGEQHADTAVSLTNLGTLLLAMGEYREGRSHLERALQILDAIPPDNNRVERARVLGNLGTLHQSIGQYAAARTYFDQALAINKKAFGEKHYATALLLSNLGVLHRAMKDYPAARTYFERALAISREINGDKHSDTAVYLNNLGDLHLAREDFAAARPHLDEALAVNKEVLGEKHPATAMSLNNLGFLHQAMGEYAAARPLYVQALASFREIYGEKHLCSALPLNNLSLLDAASGRWPEAAANMEQARRMVRWHVARVLPSMSAREQATFLAATDEDWFHEALSLGWRRAADPALASLSSGWLLNGKAVAQESLAQRALLARQSSDPAVGATIKELLWVRQQLAALVLSTVRPGEEQARREQLKQFEGEEESLARRLSQATGQPLQADPWVEFTAVRRALPADAVFIDIARFRVRNFEAKGRKEKWHPARYAAWLVRPSDQRSAMSIIDLGDADKVDQAVREVRTAIGGKGTICQQGEPEAEAVLRKPLEKLSDLVLAPIISRLGKTRSLILSPDAALWLVPWGALLLADGRYAIEQYQIRYVVSGRDLVPRQAADPKTHPPVIMADPDFDLSPAATQTATRAVLRGRDSAGDDQLRSLGPKTSSSALPKATRLPYTAVEAELISPTLQTYTDEAPVLYTDKSALEGVFKALQRPQVAMLSTHGFFLEDQEAKHDDGMRMSSELRSVTLTVDGKPIENPLLRCGLLLAGCNEGGASHSSNGEDGILTGMEIVGTDLGGTELAVLSACETGLGQVRNGEGVAGLRQAFQLAGAKAVVATLWQIPDRESARLMTTFFENLAVGQTKADALRSAQLKMIEYRRDKFGAAHPFYWAAFTITGE